MKGEKKMKAYKATFMKKNGELRTANCTAWRITYANGNVANTKTHEEKVESFVNQENPDLAF